MASAVLFTLGWFHRQAAPIHALLLLLVMTYRNSWSMIYHSQTLVILHTIVLAMFPAADAWSIDALLANRSSAHHRARRRQRSTVVDRTWIYGWAIWLISAMTVTTYVLSGVAKVVGPLGWEWAHGASLRDQVAVDAIRKELLGSESSPWAFWLYPYVHVFTCLGVGSLALELGAPLALLRRRIGCAWAFLTWTMHWGIFAIMGIEFRYQLGGFVFASFFPLERLVSFFRRAEVGGPASQVKPRPQSMARHRSWTLALIAGTAIAAGIGAFHWFRPPSHSQIVVHELVRGN
jgi:hypothetical protein